MPIPMGLLMSALKHGGSIDLSDGHLTIICGPLPEDLADDIEEALTAAMAEGEEVTTH